jgi:hypothetical protein
VTSATLENVLKLYKKYVEFQQRKTMLSGSLAELAKASFIHFRDPGSNLSSDRKYFFILFVLHLKPNLEGVNY